MFSVHTLSILLNISCLLNILNILLKLNLSIV